MDDERRRREQLEAAPTTPAPPPPQATLAAGSDPEETLDMPAADAVADPGTPPAGAAIGHFIVKRRLGEGGMGVVLACEDADLGRPVAVKLVRADAEHPAYRARLLREAQAMARLEHPNVVKVYEVGSERGRLFVAMELVDGITLTAWLREARPWRDVRAMFEQIGAGLAAVHAAGLVHRDFKPDNVLIDHAGRARVADFGLARIERADPLTRSGVMMGTPGYMAPEQQFGGDVDARADQYSFCVALREALGGRPLDDARWNAVPRDVRAIVTRGLSYEPTERYASMDELLAELRGAGRGRPRWVAGVATVTLVGALAGGAAVVMFGGHDDAPAKGSALAGSAIAPGSGSAAIVAPAPGSAVAIAPAPDTASAPVDAGVAATVRHDGGVAHHRDAGVVVATVDPGAPVAMVAGSGANGAPALNVISPHSKHLPVAQVGDPGHLPIVRAAIKDLGYDGMAFDRPLDELATSLQQEVDAARDVDRGIAETKLGMVERKRGDCAAASQHWEDVATLIKFVDSEPQVVWLARAWEGRALCSLAAGKPDAALDQMNHAWVHGNQDDVKALMAMAKYDAGADKNLVYGLFLSADMTKNARTAAALHAWLDGMGLSLR